MQIRNSKTTSLSKSNWLSGLLVTSFVGSLCFYLITVAFAAPGDLDTTFAGTGKTLIGFGRSDDEGSSVAIQSDGKIVVAGRSIPKFGVARYNTDGSLDTFFDGDGKLTTAISGDAKRGAVQFVQFRRG